MNYRIELTDNFKKEAKRLSKKYRSLKSDLSKLIAELETNPTSGTHLGQDVYKIRMAITSKGKGKSGGARILTFVKLVDSSVYLFSIYHKGEKDSVSDRDIKKLVQDLLD